jgi:hypothetical protein
VVPEFGRSDFIFIIVVDWMVKMDGKNGFSGTISQGYESELA